MLETAREKSNLWITNIRPDQEVKYRLFCFPHAGGGASLYRPWLTQLSPEVDLCPVQLPGRETRLRDRPVSNLMDLIQALVEIVHPHLNVPFAFFGHCVGALVAFELGRELKRRNYQQPAHLFISGFRSPDLPNPNRVLHELPEPEFIDEMRRYGGMSELILQDTSLLKRLLPSLRADFCLHETYVYADDEKLACPLSVFGGTQDALVLHDHLSGWRDKTCGQTTIQMFPGGHFYLITHRQLLLETVSRVVHQHINEGLIGQLKNDSAQTVTL